MGETARTDRLGLAIGVLLLTTLALSFGDALIKGASGDIGLWQMFILRSAVALPAFLALMFWLARGRLWPKHPLWVLVRVALLVSMWVAYYLSLPHLQLSVAAAAYYTLPIFLTLFSAVILGERIDLRGWIAVVLGFAGVVVILRPGVEGLNLYVLLPLLAAMLYALAMIVTRVKCREDHPVVLGNMLALGFVAAGALGLLVFRGGDSFLSVGWMPLHLVDWGTMTILALALLVGSIGAAIAYQNGPPATLGVFDFSYVGYAVLWGVLLFDDLPSPLTLTGIGMIVLAGVLATWRR